MVIFFEHIILFLTSIGIVWFFSGLIVDAIDRMAARFHKSSFTVAFFVLGFLTSISEFSVMVNSTLAGAPQISAGNLSGASFIILLFIIPLLAIIGNGIQVKNTLPKKHLALVLAVIALPTLFLLDGEVVFSEGVVSLIGYGILIYFIRKHKPRLPDVIEGVKNKLVDKHDSTFMDILKLVVGAISIFFAGYLLVQEVIYFSGILGIPNSAIGLIVLSLGTNVPELAIAIRSIGKQKNNIAFGDYLGSAVANTLLFGLLILLNGNFGVTGEQFFVTAGLMIAGFIAFYISASSKRKISRFEGCVLICFYILFLITQISALLNPHI